MSIKSTCIQYILANQSPKAIQYLLSQYNLYDDDDAVLCYKLWCKIRSEFHRNDDHLHPQYNDHLRSYLADPSLLPDDRRKIQNLLEASLATKYKVYKMTRPYLSNVYYDTLLKSVHPAISSIYEFELPATFKNRAWRLSKQQDEDRIENGEVRLCSREEAQAIFQKTTCLLDRLQSTPVNSSAECIERIVCLQIVCGRRFQEIVKSATFLSHPQYPFQCLVQGLLKSASVEPQRFEIPILVPFPLLYRHLQIIRRYSNDHVLPDNYVKKCSLALFGVPLVHGSLRNLYLELAYHDRQRSRFYPCAPRVYFDMKALCHQERVTSTMSYQRLAFTGDDR